MSYSPYVRACLLIPFNDKPHLFVVLNDPCEDELCLLVMFSSNKDGKYHDPACVLQKGAHEFIDKATHVVYRLANTIAASHISNMVEKRYYIPKEDLSVETFAEVVSGLHSSDETKPFAIKYAKKNGIISKAGL